MNKALFIYILPAFLFWACDHSEKTLFRLIESNHTNIDFSNDLTFSQDFNIFKYRNYYNGGGIGLIDFNNDNLPDIYMVANMGPNKLFKNEGGFKFADVTETAGVSGTHAWCTGVTVADVNADGWPDIYICNSGDVPGDNKQNELFINNGDGTFSEKGEEYGLANRGFSIHAAFFDYDKDGDLDMYLVNNSYKAIGSFNLVDNKRWERDSNGGDKLFRNDNGFFIDVSEETGIYGSVIGFGLGVTIADINNDNWLDIYISNDFFERDYLYINNHQGGFEEKLEDHIKSISAAAMGADIGDLNNDGYLEIFVTDMLPYVNERIKTVTTFDSWERYQFGFENDYWHQFTRNVLQYNNGDNTFSEIGRLAGVEASDWSWAPLIFDLQNDGLKDIFISNGITQDLTNQDFLQYVTQDEITMQITAGGRVDYETLISYIPSVAIPNHAFVNKGDFTFTNKSKELGLDQLSFSNGAVYGDLDNDGDLDIVINNANMPMFLYENRTETFFPENHYLRFILKGENGNTNAFGTRIKAFADNKTFMVEHLPTRGFQSSIDNRPLLGLGKHNVVDLEINWPSGKQTILKQVAANQELVLNESDGRIAEAVEQVQTNPLYVELDTAAFPARHTENQFNDFARDKLIFEMLSTQGPCMCKGDINKDGLEDIFFGGAMNFQGQLFAQTKEGRFEKIDNSVFDRTMISEDIDCALFDANGDGNLDLYVASGGNEYNPSVPAMNDRLYFGNGKFGFTLVRQNLPAGKFESSSVVKPVDFDGDNDIDLFVGIFIKPYFLGEPCNGYILENDGSGNFKNVSAEIAPDLEKLGMITDAAWTDLENDGDLDLVVVGKWMPVTVFLNKNGKFEMNNDIFPNSRGWWNTVEIADLNNDGLKDVVAGNHGLNTRFRTSPEKPLHMFVKDFDRNGTTEQIICQYEGSKLYTLALKHDMAMQMPHINAKYPRYEDYKDQQITDVFSSEELKDATALTAEELATVVYLSKGDLTYYKAKLPFQVQFSSTYAILVKDFNDDKNPDILLGGNMYESKPEVGIYDASYGVLLLGDGEGEFDFMPVIESGIKIDRAVRKILQVQSPPAGKIIVANNNDKAQIFQKRTE
jgi:hypothetical protein